MQQFENKSVALVLTNDGLVRMNAAFVRAKDVDD